MAAHWARGREHLGVFHSSKSMLCSKATLSFPLSIHWQDLVTWLILSGDFPVPRLGIPQWWLEIGHGRNIYTTIGFSFILLPTIWACMEDWRASLRRDAPLSLSKILPLSVHYGLYYLPVIILITHMYKASNPCEEGAMILQMNKQRHREGR